MGHNSFRFLFRHVFRWSGLCRCFCLCHLSFGWSDFMKENHVFKMLLTFERKGAQRSDFCQRYHTIPAGQSIFNIYLEKKYEKTSFMAADHQGGCSKVLHCCNCAKNNANRASQNVFVSVEFSLRATFLQRLNN